NRLLPTPHEHALQNLFGRVDFLVRHVGRHVNEVAWACLSQEFEPVAPAHPSFPLDDVDDRLDGAMVVSSRLRTRLNGDGPGPKLLRADPGTGNGSFPTHSGGLSGVGVQCSGLDDVDSLGAPIRCVHSLLPSLARKVPLS